MYHIMCIYVVFCMLIHWSTLAHSVVTHTSVVSQIEGDTTACIHARVTLAVHCACTDVVYMRQDGSTHALSCTLIRNNLFVVFYMLLYELDAHYVLTDVVYMRRHGS